MFWNFGGSNGTKDTDDKGRQEGQNGPRNEGIQTGRTEVGVEDRPQSQEPRPSDSDRPQGERTVEDFTNGYEQRHREEVEAKIRGEKQIGAYNAQYVPPVGQFPAGQCAPYNIRVHLLNGQWLDNTNVTVSWVEWLRAFHMHHGLLTHDGYTPSASVATIMILQPPHVKPTTEYSGNIIPFGGKK